MSGFFFYKWQDAESKIPISADQEAQQLVDTINEFYELPSGETPSVATIEDVEKLSEQTFFANAQNGDKLLIFEAAEQAFIYRESTNKIINSGPIAVTQEKNESPEEQIVPDPVVEESVPVTTNIRIYGSATGLEQLSTAVTSIANTDVVTTTAVYELGQGVVLYDSDDQRSIAESLAQTFEPSILPAVKDAALPADVSAVIDRTSADIIVILAQ